jgi:hypothetical protein
MLEVERCINPPAIPAKVSRDAQRSASLPITAARVYAADIPSRQLEAKLNLARALLELHSKNPTPPTSTAPAASSSKSSSKISPIPAPQNSEPCSRASWRKSQPSNHRMNDRGTPLKSHYSRRHTNNYDRHARDDRRKPNWILVCDRVAGDTLQNGSQEADDEFAICTIPSTCPRRN